MQRFRMKRSGDYTCTTRTVLHRYTKRTKHIIRVRCRRSLDSFDYGTQCADSVSFEMFNIRVFVLYLLFYSFFLAVASSKIPLAHKLSSKQLVYLHSFFVFSIEYTFTELFEICRQLNIRQKVDKNM